MVQGQVFLKGGRGEARVLALSLSTFNVFKVISFLYTFRNFFTLCLCKIMLCI